MHILLIYSIFANRDSRVKVRAIKMTRRILRNWKVLKLSFFLSKRDGRTRYIDQYEDF